MASRSVYLMKNFSNFACPSYVSGQWINESRTRYILVCYFVGICVWQTFGCTHASWPLSFAGLWIDTGSRWNEAMPIVRVTFSNSLRAQTGNIRLASFFHDGCPMPRGGPLSLVKDSRMASVYIRGPPHSGGLAHNSFTQARITYFKSLKTSI